MAEFEPDQESVSRAERLSSQLMRDVRTVSEKGPSLERREFISEQRYADVAEGAPLNDVIAHVDQMAVEFAIARRWDRRILCLKLEDKGLAPISIAGQFGGTFGQVFDSELWFELWRIGPPSRPWRKSLRWLQSDDKAVTDTDLDSAAEGAQRSLSGFLSYRFAGMRLWEHWLRGTGGPLGGEPPPPPSVSVSGGLRVQVSCSTPGLSIDIAPAFFIDWVFFGAPTTPVTSFVLPGRYIFSGKGPMLPRRKRDTGVFRIPPTYNPVLTSF